MQRRYLRLLASEMRCAASFGQERLWPGELREWLGAGLVEYTVPGRWVDLERSPRTASASPPGAPSEPAVLLATGLGSADVAELDAGVTG